MVVADLDDEADDNSELFSETEANFGDEERHCMLDDVNAITSADALISHQRGVSRDTRQVGVDSVQNSGYGNAHGGVHNNRRRDATDVGDAPITARVATPISRKPPMKSNGRNQSIRSQRQP